MIFPSKLSSAGKHYDIISHNGRNQRWVALSTLHQLCEQMDLADKEKSYVLFCIDHEVQSLEIEGKGKGYIIEMAEPFVGLGQFAKRTWLDLERAGILPYPYSTAGEPVADISAIVALYRANLRSFLSQWGKSSASKFTNAMAYLYHNQGAPQAKSFLASNAFTYPGQSHKALATMRTARGEFYG